MSYFEEKRELKNAYHEDTTGRAYHPHTATKPPVNFTDPNGEKETQCVHLDEPMKKEEFAKLNDTLKKLYIEHLRKKYNARQTDIAAMLGYDRAYFGKLCIKLGFKPRKGPYKPKKTEEVERWNEFLGVDTTMEQAPVTNSSDNETIQKLLDEKEILAKEVAEQSRTLSLLSNEIGHKAQQVENYKSEYHKLLQKSMEYIDSFNNMKRYALAFGLTALVLLFAFSSMTIKAKNVRNAYDNLNDEYEKLYQSHIELTEQIETEATEKTEEAEHSVEETLETVTESTTIVETSTEPTPVVETVTESELVNNGEFVLTAYCTCYNCCGKTPDSKGYGITATGTKATANRTIAVDPSVIPLGATVIINGKEYIAEDTGGAVKGKRIDIFFDSHEAALNFGRQTAEVLIK